MALSIPALQSMPPRLVADDHLARTNALVSLTDELAIVLGPVAAGVAIAAFGFRGAFVFDAVTYAHRPGRAAPRPPAASRGHDATTPPPVRMRDALEGYRIIAGTRVLRRVVACTFSVHLLYGLALLAEPLYVRDTLERSEEVFAALQTAFGVCLVAGGLARGPASASGWRRSAGSPLGVGVSGLTAIVYLGTPWLAVAFVGVALWGVATAVISGPSRTVLQRSSPERAHGRVLSADYVAANTAELVGLGIAGVLVSAFGVPWSVLILGLSVTVGRRIAGAGRPARSPRPGAGAGRASTRRSASRCRSPPT